MELQPSDKRILQNNLLVLRYFNMLQTNGFLFFSQRNFSLDKLILDTLVIKTALLIKIYQFLNSNFTWIKSDLQVVSCSSNTLTPQRLNELYLASFPEGEVTESLVFMGFYKYGTQYLIFDKIRLGFLLNIFINYRSFGSVSLTVSTVQSMFCLALWLQVKMQQAYWVMSLNSIKRVSEDVVSDTI